jgi:23S rRNA pseudouridine2605 synthase
MSERLQKLISQAGLASRRDAEDLITAGRVTVNGKVAGLGDKADPATDEVRVDGERLRFNTPRIYVIVNKPMGIVSTARPQEQETRRTVRDLIPLEGHLYPVGRLDADSEGLVLLTNDGDLAEKLTHPRYRKPKVYEVTLRGNISDEALDIWRSGIVLEDGPTLPVEIKVLRRESNQTVIQITMTEGRKRQIRRMANTFGHPVQRLVRTHLATLSLANLRPGEWRYLTAQEIKTLSEMADRASEGPRRPGNHLPSAEKIRRLANEAREAAEADAPARPYRPAGRRPGPERNYRERGYRPRREEGDSRLPRRDSDQGERRSFRPRREEGEYRPRREEGDSRPRREEGDSRPPRREENATSPRSDRPARPDRRPTGGPPRSRPGSDTNRGGDRPYRPGRPARPSGGHLRSGPRPPSRKPRRPRDD